MTLRMGMFFPYINPPGFPAGDYRRPGLNSLTTWDAIIAGERTATTRLYNNYRRWPWVWQEILQLRPGQQVVFTKKELEMIVEVTAPPQVVTLENAAQWSKLEGWNEEFLAMLLAKDHPGNARQFQFRFVELL